MIKRLALVFITAFAIQTQAQEGTASPYSFFGIGSLKFKGTVENRSMGGLSIYNDSIHVNLRNPAGYATSNLSIWNNESRPVKFTVGGSHSSTTLKADGSSARTGITSFDYFALSVPMGKLGLGFGMMPYTSVGYKLESTNSQNVLTNRYQGKGGLNKVFLGVGYQVYDGLSVGVNANYNFGNTQNSAIRFLYDADGNLVQYQSKENNRSDLSGLNFNFGVSYTTMIDDKLELVTGATYTPKSNLVSQNKRSFSTIFINPNTGAEAQVETTDANLGNLNETELTLPAKFSFGGGVGMPRKWFLGAELKVEKSSSFNNPIFSINNSTFQDATTVSLGGFYVPDYDSFSGYWKRVVYRVGMHFGGVGLKVNNEDINEFGMSFGVGLPVGGMFSNANLGLEFGKRGTQNQNLIQENFLNFHISLSLNDRWFQKIKYN